MAFRPLPHATRSDVFNALFALIKTIPPPVNQKWRTFSQDLVSWSDVPAENQPAMFLHRLTQTAEQKHVFGVTRWHWTATIWIYFRSDSYRTTTTYPDQVTDPMLDAIEQTFQTEPGDVHLTLGGLVHHCWIDGTIFTDPGMEDNQAVIVVPVSILL